MKQLRIISKIVDLLKWLLTVGLLMCPMLIITNLVGWTYVNYWLVFSPVLILMAFPVVMWLLGFFVLLYRNIREFFIYRYLFRNMKKAKRQQDKIKRDLDSLSRKV